MGSTRLALHIFFLISFLKNVQGSRFLHLPSAFSSLEDYNKITNPSGGSEKERAKDHTHSTLYGHIAILAFGSHSRQGQGYLVVRRFLRSYKYPKPLKRMFLPFTQVAPKLGLGTRANSSPRVPLPHIPTLLRLGAHRVHHSVWLWTHPSEGLAQGKSIPFLHPLGF